MPFSRVKYHRCHICAHGVNPLRMVTGFGYVANPNRRCCESHRSDDDAKVTLVVEIESFQAMVSSCPMLLTEYERCDRRPFHYRLHVRMEAVQNLK